MARTFGRGIRQIRNASQEIQDDIKKAAFDDPTSDHTPKNNS